MFLANDSNCLYQDHPNFSLKHGQIKTQYFTFSCFLQIPFSYIPKKVHFARKYANNVRCTRNTDVLAIVSCFKTYCTKKQLSHKYQRSIVNKEAKKAPRKRSRKSDDIIKYNV